MVPLINIVFLLLVFFMLTSTIRVIDPVDSLLPTAESGSRADPPRATLAVSAAGGYFLDGDEIPAGALGVTLETLVVGGIEEILLKVDGSGTIGVLRSVMEVARSAGVKRVALATRPEGN